MGARILALRETVSGFFSLYNDQIKTCNAFIFSSGPEKSPPFTMIQHASIGKNIKENMEK